MSEKGKKILETIGKALPSLSDQEVDKLLSFSEGMAFMADCKNRTACKAENQSEGREIA